MRELKLFGDVNFTVSKYDSANSVAFFKDDLKYDLEIYFKNFFAYSDCVEVNFIPDVTEQVFKACFDLI